MPTITEDQRKHLEFIQNVITRMNSNSFTIKGWAITLVSALFALAAKDSDVRYVLISYISIFTFWCLDAYYLSMERQYRSLYNDIIDPSKSIQLYSMSIENYNKDKNTWLSSFYSKSISILYLTTTGLTLVVMYLFKHS